MNERNRIPEADQVDRDFYEWAECIVAALLFCVIVFTFIGRVVCVKGDSMIPTLRDRERVVISCLSSRYGRSDIVVLRKDSFKADPIVKRVIACGGQTVELDTENGIVLVDGLPLDEPYVNELTFKAIDYTEPVEVPEGCVFVMGDNRNNSVDSRSELVGCVDTRYILGRVVFRVFPMSRFGAIHG